MKDFIELSVLVEALELISNRVEYSFSIPQKSILEKLIYAAFSVSCKTEEERRLSFRLACLDLDDTNVLGHLPCATIFRFEKRIDFLFTNSSRLHCPLTPVGRLFVLVTNMALETSYIFQV